jgi:hypothetical protein
LNPFLQDCVSGHPNSSFLVFDAYELFQPWNTPLYVMRWKGASSDMRKRLICIVGLVSLGRTTVAAEDASDRFYHAIRNDDLSTVRGLMKASTANSKDQRESTPLMHAAA